MFEFDARKERSKIERDNVYTKYVGITQMDHNNIIVL